MQIRITSDRERSHELLTDIVSESDYTTALVNDLVLLSRRDAGRLELARIRIDLGAYEYQRVYVYLLLLR
jgi:signal transduction histidine kinase